MRSPETSETRYGCLLCGREFGGRTLSPTRAVPTCPHCGSEQVELLSTACVGAAPVPA